MIPNKIGRYRIKGELGRGGMSTVYLAHDPHFERDVAIKLLPLELLHQSTFRRRFEREAKVVAALDHPAIVPVYDFGEEDEQPFLVMRFMMGGSLTDRLRQGALTIKEAASIISRLAIALDEVHAHGIIHRDLKPSNILFDQRNYPYISDFGTAKISQAQTKLTETGGAVGTPAYMSPEQIQGDHELDGRSDIYSLGIILFEMLTGKHPYQTNTPIAVAVKHIFEPVPHILDMVPSLPIEVQEVIGRAMAKERGGRFVTAVAFANALAKIANTIETHTLSTISDRHITPARRYAMVINNNQYHDPILGQLVKYSSNAERLAELLREPGIGNFDEVKLLTNQPTDVVRRHIARFFAHKRSDDLLLLYYIGHAAIGLRSRLYLTAPNTEHNLLRGTTIPAGFIADEMDSCQSKNQILILDSHFSHTVETDRANIIGQTVNAGANFTRNNPNRIVITATDSTQFMWRDGKVQGKARPSQFTRHFIEGLESGAADLGNDGAISINELFAFIYDRVVRNSVDQQIQTPRKWSPYDPIQEDQVIIAKSFNQLLANGPRGTFKSIKSDSTANLSGKIMASPLLSLQMMKQYGRYALFILLVLISFTALLRRDRSPSDDVVFANATETQDEQISSVGLPVPTASPTPSAIVISQASPTAPSTPTPTAPIVPSPPATPDPTATAVPPVTLTAHETAVALLSSSVYQAPDSHSAELSFVGVDDIVQILGRSEAGSWFYIRTQNNEEGYVYEPRFSWNGDFDTLPIYHAVEIFQPIENNSCQESVCPPLTMEFYPLPGTRCEVEGKFRSLFIRGSGGDSTYSYYWNGELIATQVADGVGFEIYSPDGSSQIGIGRVVSGDGQAVEMELFVTEFNNCE